MAARREIVVEWRCWRCNRKLGESSASGTGTVSIKCAQCKALNNMPVDTTMKDD